MKFSDTAIVSDIDGTFTDPHSQLVRRNLDALEYYRANGGLFATATGRVPEMMGVLEPVIADIANIPCISCNGAFAYDFRENRAYNEIFLDADRASELVKRAVAEFPEVSARLSSKNGKYVLHKTSYTEWSARIVGFLPVDEVPRCGWYRIAFDGPCESLDAIRGKFEAEYSDSFDFVKSCPTIYEFNDKKATKGTALDRLRELLISSGRASEKLRIYAVGDYENDLDMLRHADVPCCPANAIDSVKAISRLKVCSCGDGAIADIVEAIEKGF
ncbi:MAG: HAD-IIB family hydrolase [Candidatus Flemingiibacterium sp.]